MRHLLILLLILFCAGAACAQHALGERAQWQPDTDEAGFSPDRRLEQRLDIEILGRGLIPALEILTEKSGVSLFVAPEDIYTVGERKLTVISQGLTLQQIMANIPFALQECHWDIDNSGPAPVYLLHRNGDAASWIEWLQNRDTAAARAKNRVPRVDRLMAALEGLDKSPQEMGELEKYDLFLARSLQDPYYRGLLELFLHLPPDKFQQFEETGSVSMPYQSAPEEFKTAGRRLAERFFEGKSRGFFNDGQRAVSGPLSEAEAAVEPLYEGIRNWEAGLSHATIGFHDYGTDFGFGVWLMLKFHNKQGEGGLSDIALMPRFPSRDEGDIAYRVLLQSTGAPSNEAAIATITAWEQKGFDMRHRETEERRAREWAKPEDEALLRTVAIQPKDGEPWLEEFAQFQKMLSDETGLSVISDYFTTRRVYLPDEVRAGMPLWEALYRMGEYRAFGEPVLWEKRGNCLVFHYADWYRLTEAEIPESLLSSLQERLASQGRLTLDDLAGFALALEGRGLGSGSLPMDLRRAGASSVGFAGRALRFYATLTPAQKEAAASPAGLAYEEMNLAQKQVVLLQAKELLPPVAPAAVEKATFHLEQSLYERRQLRWDKADFRLRFGERAQETSVMMLLPPKTE